MRNYRYWIIALWSGIFLSSLFGQTVSSEYADGQLYWRVQSNIAPQLSDSILQHYQIQSITCPFGVLNPKKLKGGESLAKLHRTYKIQFNALGSVSQLAGYLKTLPITEMTERVPLANTFFTPNDPQFPSQWNLAAINASTAWNLSFGNANVRVAVVDDAVRTTHQDLSGAIWTNPGEIAGNGIDDDGNGYVDDLRGYDVSDNDNDPNPPLAFATSSVYTHGTHCAGIVGASTHNATGIASIGFGVKIIPVKCNSDATPGPSLPNAWDGVIYAITHTPDAISLSWGGPGSSSTHQALIDVAYANGSIVVAAAGNSNVNTPMFPASYNHVISVAATAPGDLKASFSNYGPTIDVSAPGVNILSTLAGSNSDYGNLSGTSMATPLVAGLCGLMKSFNPAMTVDQIDSCLRTTADPIDALNPGFAGQLGAGRINALQALQCVSGPPIANFSANFTHVCPGTVVSFTNQSFGSPTSYQWYFQGGFPSTSTAQNPSINYNFPGTFYVRLIVSNGLGTDTLIYNSIVVATPTAVMSGGGLINPGSPAFIQVNFTGSPPYSFTYTDGTSNYFVSGITATPYTFIVSPPVSTTYSLVGMNSANCAGSISGNAVVIVSSGCSAPVSFQDIMGGPLADQPVCIKQTPDCGYIVSGRTYSFGTGAFEGFLAKLDQTGSMLWFNTYGDASDDSHFWDVIPVSNGYVAAGYRGASNIGGPFIIKTDLNGNLIWQQQIRFTSGGGAISGSVKELVELSNGDLALSGTVMHSNFNTTGQTMLRLNGITGALIWQRVAQVNNYEGSDGIIRVGGDHLVQAGHSRSTGVSSGLYDMVLTKRDINGNLIWSKNYGGPQNEYLQDLVKLPDQGFLCVGYTEGFSSTVSDMVIMRTDSSGNLIWTKQYGRPAADQATKIVAGCNGKYYVLGPSRTSGMGNDALLLQIDINGNVLWARNVGGVLDDGNFLGMGRTGDCGCAITLSTQTFGVGDDDILIAKTDSLGNFSCHADIPVVSVTNISPILRIASPTSLSGIAPSFTSINTTVLPAQPERQDSVCDACGTPVANFDFVTNVFSLALLDASVNGQNWRWDFGDGTPGDTLRNAVHVYASTGTYTVTLIVSSPCGSDTLSKQVTITGLNECLHVLQPGPVNGIDAFVFSRDDTRNTNSGNSTIINMATWTWSGNVGTYRSYLKFDLSRICNSANLLDARFTAYHNTIFGQPHSGSNQEFMYRCLTPWDEFAVTWLNQPTVTTTNGINVPIMTGTANLTNLNVQPIFQDMITGPNHGFQWRLQTEGTYRRTMYASSDWPNPTERPLLTLRFDPIFAHAHIGSDINQHSINICHGDSVQLNLAGYDTPGVTSGPSTATRYLWVPSIGLSCDTCPNPKASPDSTITYRAVAYNCPSCADIDTIRITVSRVWVEAPNQILCTGDSVQMQAFHPLFNGTQFIWTPSTHLSNPNIQNPTAAPTIPTWYHVTATDTVTGCISSDSALVLTGAPSPLPTMIPDTVLDCNNGLVTFPLNSAFTPIGSDYYEWNLVGNITPDPNSPSSIAEINTNIFPAVYHFILSVTNSFGCVTKDSVDVIVDCILPGSYLSLSGESTPLGNHLAGTISSNLPPSDLELQRSWDGSFFSTFAVEAYLPNGQAQMRQWVDRQVTSGETYYRLKAYSSDGATYYSEIVRLIAPSQEGLSITPNPTHGAIRITASGSPSESATLRIWNAMGQMVGKASGLQGMQWDYDLSNMPNGIYWIQITKGNRNQWIKVAKQ